jgi:SynChlorMet cassette protein ScmC
MSFLIELGNGRQWSLIHSSDTQRWVEKFASLMGVKDDKYKIQNNCARLIFVGNKSKRGAQEIPPNITTPAEDDLPRTGWESLDFKAIRLWTHGTVPHMICEIDDESNGDLDIIKMWIVTLGIALQVVDSGGALLHGALIERNGKGFVLAGPGGSGKSTLSRRLPPGWNVLCDDQVLLVPVDKDKYLAHPIPTWSEHLWKRSKKSWNFGSHVPLRAVFFIEQFETDQIISLGQGNTAVLISDSMTAVCNPLWLTLSADDELIVKKQFFDNACGIARSVPAYILRNNLDGRFWTEIEKVL